jgi:hypothetical protein
MDKIQWSDEALEKNLKTFLEKNNYTSPGNSVGPHTILNGLKNENANMYIFSTFSLTMLKYFSFSLFLMIRHRKERSSFSYFSPVETMFFLIFLPSELLFKRCYIKRRTSNTFAFLMVFINHFKPKEDTTTFRTP